MEWTVEDAVESEDDINSQYSGDGWDINCGQSLYGLDIESTNIDRDSTNSNNILLDRKRKNREYENDNKDDDSRYKNDNDDDEDDNSLQQDTMDHKPNRPRAANTRYINSVSRPDRFIPWDRIATSMNLETEKSNDDTILKYLPYPEMDQLLGWATGFENGSHHDSDLILDGIMCSPSSMFDQINPLECLSNSSTRNVPLHPSYVQYIQDTAMEMISGKEDKIRRRNKLDTKMSDTIQESELSADGIDDEAKRQQSRNRYSQVWTEFSDQIVPPNVSASTEHCLLERYDISAFVAIGMIVEEMITASLLPLAQQHVDRCRQLEQQEYDNEKNITRQRTDYGHTKQEVYTTPIQPYDIQMQHSFFHWTLPPEEAIANLIQPSIPNRSNKIEIKTAGSDIQPFLYNKMYGFPTAYPPTRCCTVDCLPYLKQKVEKIERKKAKRRNASAFESTTTITSQVPSERLIVKGPLEVSTDNWCMTRKYPDAVRNTKLERKEAKVEKSSKIPSVPIYNFDTDLFRILLPHIPPPYHKRKDMVLRSKFNDRRYVPAPVGLQYVQPRMEREFYHQSNNISSDDVTIINNDDMTNITDINHHASNLSSWIAEQRSAKVGDDKLDDSTNKDLNSSTKSSRDMIRKKPPPPLMSQLRKNLIQQQKSEQPEM